MAWKTKHSAKELRRRSDRAWEIKSAWRPLHEECYMAAYPSGNPYVMSSDGSAQNRENQSPGRRLRGRNFDSVMQRMTRRGVSKAKFILAPPFDHWVVIEQQALNTEMLKSEETQMLQMWRQELFNRLDEGNFDLALTAQLYDTYVAGTGAMRLGYGRQGSISFTDISQATVGLEGDSTGEVWGMFRRAKMTPKELQYRYPDYDPKLPDISDESMREGNKPHKYDILECCTWDPMDKMWDYTIIVIPGSTPEDSDLSLDEEKVLYWKRYPAERPPWVISRWSRLPGEVHGRSPVMDVLDDHAALNAVKKFTLQATATAARPMYAVQQDAMISMNNVELRPGALLPVTHIDAITQLPVVSSLPTSEWSIEELRDGIEKSMSSGTPQMSEKDGNPRTATEIRVLHEEMQTNFGNAFSQISRDVLIPIVTAALSRIVPAKFWAGARFRLVTPLAEGKKMRELANIGEFMEMAMGMVGPEAVNTAIDMTGMVQYLAKLKDIPEELLRSDEEIEQMQQAAVEQTMMAQQQEGAAQGGQQA